MRPGRAGASATGAEAGVWKAGGGAPRAPRAGSACLPLSPVRRPPLPSWLLEETTSSILAGPRVELGTTPTGPRKPGLGPAAETAPAAGSAPGPGLNWRKPSHTKKTQCNRINKILKKKITKDIVELNTITQLDIMTSKVLFNIW